MDIARVGQVPSFVADGVATHVLLRQGTFDAHNLLVTWTVVAPRAQMRGHSHAGSEQVYVILSGMGRMQVGGEKQVLSPGTLVYVPPNTPHCIGNAGEEDLVYLTAASPPFPVERLFAGMESSQAQEEDRERVGPVGRPVGP